MTEYYVEIRRYAEGDEVDDTTVKRMGPYVTERQAEKIDRGANINLNHQDYYTEIVEE